MQKETKKRNEIKYPELIKSDIKLTIGMLVSNHVQYIRKVMDGLKPLLDAIPCELVVIDTKGEDTDGSIEICREYTDKIYCFEWCNDFSAARNFCLNHASGEWFMYQDDDEWFDDVQEFIDFFQSGECEKYYCGYYYTRDYLPGGGYSRGIAGRMVRRTVETKFEGRVHEHYNKVYAPCKNFNCFTHHMGYLYTTAEDAKKHQERNLSILKEEFAEYGYTVHICSQMMQEYLCLKETMQNGFEFAQECLDVFRERGCLKEGRVQWMIVATVRYFTLIGDYEKQMAEAEKVWREYPLSPMAALVLAAVMSIDAAKHEDTATLLYYAKIFLEQWDWLNAHEDEALQQSQLDFPRYYTEECFYNVIGLAAISANRIEDYALANSYWKRLPWKSESFPAYKYAAEMQKTIDGLKALVSGEKKEYTYDNSNSAKQAEQQPFFVKSEVKLTIGLMVSNHKQYIRKVMEGIKPLLEAVPSELIVVDTKGESGDGSIDIVREYTDKIYRFNWCNDFSAARNVCLEHAKGEWFLYQDDDEWFEDVQELITFFNSAECENYNSGYYYTKDYKSNGTFSKGIAGRLVRRTEDTYFVGRVHEGFNKVYGPSKVFSCCTNHYGYVFSGDGAKKKHQDRNLCLLRLDLEEQGLTPRICAQLMQELLSRIETAEEGYQFFKENIKFLQQDGQIADACTQWMLVASVRYFKIIKDFDGLLLQARKIKGSYPLNQMAQAALAGVVIESSAPKGNMASILEYAPMYKDAYLWLQQHEAEAITQQQFDLPKYVTKDYAIQVFQAAATCSNAVKAYVQAYGYWEMLPWNDVDFDGSRYLERMQETLKGLEGQ